MALLTFYVYKSYIFFLVQGCGTPLYRQSTIVSTFHLCVCVYVRFIPFQPLNVYYATSIVDTRKKRYEKHIFI